VVRNSRDGLVQRWPGHANEEEDPSPYGLAAWPPGADRDGNENNARSRDGLKQIEMAMKGFLGKMI
jgi:hypothetical protein